jgi:transposase
LKKEAAVKSILLAALLRLKVEKQSTEQARSRMLIKTILNRVQKFKSFVYAKVRLAEEEGQAVLLVTVVPRANSRAECSGCGQKRAGYDDLDERRFEFVPLWGIAVFFLYVMRRVDCPNCGVVVESVPWGNGKHQLTTTYAWFLAKWAKRLSWKEVSEAFQTSWEKVFSAVSMAVAWGLSHRDLSGVTAIGIDEVLWHRGHKYLTVVYQVNEHCKRLLWVGIDRKAKTLMRFFRDFGEERTRQLRFICSDMWQPYLKVLAYKAKKGLLSAVHLLDRFHLAQNMNKAIDKVRAAEAKKLKEQGIEVLKRSRWCVLKRPENLTENQELKLAELARWNLKTFRAYLLKEDFQGFWDYVSPAWAGKFLDRWCYRTMRSRIEPMKKIARSLRNHRELILNWFRAKGLISLGAVEGLNNRLKLTFRKSYGFRTFKATEIALYHTMGDLPEPPTTHRFC